ncbi:MAG: GNAT family N-acetyltransferase [Lachnospiraceae bacterium]|nr:GNAT family N-acetyltransferase [Lachnospiraceae bacterium]
MECRVIDKEHSKDINLKNDPFSLYGKVIPTYSNGQWNYSIWLFSENEVVEMCFPDENYDYDELAENHVFIGAYDSERCVGLAVLADDMFQYMYLDDLKVSRAYRKQGVGKALVEKAMEIAHQRNYRGIYAIGQDNNVSACKFYLKAGFEIGGFDNHVYRGTSQEHKANIIFYLDRQPSIYSFGKRL